MSRDAKDIFLKENLLFLYRSCLTWSLSFDNHMVFGAETVTFWKEGGIQICSSVSNCMDKFQHLTYHSIKFKFHAESFHWEPLLDFLIQVLKYLCCTLWPSLEVLCNKILLRTKKYNYNYFFLIFFLNLKLQQKSIYFSLNSFLAQLQYFCKWWHCMLQTDCAVLTPATLNAGQYCTQ